ncbi:MAG: hypothetical protein R3293_28485, partial [Candidatus Promineifilaceae bacterium]|nr:hypothetical protein [Candidatus Promineifilaceae bacterium]
PFAKHKSQIDLVTIQLIEFLDDMQVKNIAADFATQELAYCKMLGIYRIWSYFRSKLNLRRDQQFEKLLRCADELAWDCYQPARAKALDSGFIELEALKEPPLVYFIGAASPEAQARTTPFIPEGLSDRDIIDFAALVLSLPVPIVGVPWFQLNHLPALPVVAHEVGHAVETDFQLTEPTIALFNELVTDPQRREAWLSWRKEVFADVYASICMGPAYLVALIDFLLAEKDDIEKEERLPGNWGDYPTRSLRVLLNLKVLDKLNLLQFAGEPVELGRFLESLARVWFDAYPQYLMPEYGQDIENIVPTLLDAQFPAFGGTPLRDLVAYDQTHLRSSWYLGKDVLSQSIFPAEVIDGCPYRTLAAAPALAHAFAAHRYLEVGVQSNVLNELYRAIPPGTRAADPEDNQEARARKAAAARQKGREMSKFFSQR